MKNAVLLVLLLTTFFASATVRERYHFESDSQQEQFDCLTKELRCLVCQNETLEASNAPLANDLKQKIHKMILEEKSNQEIMDYLTSRYGDFIRFKPPLNAETILLWGAPILFLALGLGPLLILLRSHRHRKK